MFCLSGGKGRDAMKADCQIGGGASALDYRHPLVSRINRFLSSLHGMPDAAAKRRLRWTPFAASAGQLTDAAVEDVLGGRSAVDAWGSGQSASGRWHAWLLIGAGSRLRLAEQVMGDCFAMDPWASGDGDTLPQRGRGVEK